MRLLAVRRGGDAATAQIRQRITERVNVLDQEPSTLLGIVLPPMLATVQRGLTQTMNGVGSLDLEIIATAKPRAQQPEAHNQYRAVFQPVALRFPMYLVNLQAALIDPGPVAGLDAAGMAQLQQFETAAVSTGGPIDTLVGAVRNAAQDIQAQVGNWQSDRINVLTIVTMIFLPISFLTGHFGTSFTWLDDQLDSFSAWIVLGVALPLVLVAGSVPLLNSSGYRIPMRCRGRRAGSPTHGRGTPDNLPPADQP